jgi:hypothetical protein
MKKNPTVLICIGAILLLLGIILNFSSGPPKADTALAQQCPDNLTARNAEPSLIKQCDETAFATAMTATNAQAAAQAISAANNSEVGGSMWSMFLIGVGVILLAGGVFLRRKQIL